MQNKIIIQWLTLTILACVMSAFFGMNNYVKNDVKAQSIPTPRTSATPSPMPTVSPAPSVDSKIKEVFGKYYPKAILLLKGRKGSDCAENIGLNPNALNDNTKWGGVGRDWGVFQINDKWQGVTNTKFLKDPDINIRIAWRIFEDSGHSFKLWTCGKYYGI